MALQTLVLKYTHQHKRGIIDVPHCPYASRTFFERFGYLGTCVLPSEVLDNTPLRDAETDQMLPSLRKRCSADGICFAHVAHAFAEGLYWADVAATPDLVDAEYVMLTEEHLTFALAWDERLYWRKPASIRRLMQAHTCELAHLQPRTKSVPVAVPLPAPFIDPSADQDEAGQQYSVEVTEDDLREAVPPGHPDVQFADAPPTSGPRSFTHIKPVAPYLFQQVLLRTMLKALQRQLTQTHKRARALELKARCALVARVQHWQRRTRLRVVHVEECRWCAVRKCWVWNLTLVIQQSLLVESAAQAAA